MIGIRLVLATGLLVLVPAVDACSLAYVQYQQATWETDLHYVDGASLHRVRGGLEAVLAEGFFLSYATAGDLLLVAGQEGLGAGCEGDGWLRLERNGAKLWEKAGAARAFPDEDGPLVIHDGQAWRLREDKLVATGVAVAADTYVLGWTPAGKPVYRNTEAQLGVVGVVVGDITVPFEHVGGFEPAVARNADTTAFTFHDETRVYLYEMKGGEVRVRSWPSLTDGSTPGIAWANGWYVMGGGRAYHVGDDVTDLGLPAVAVAAHGDQGLVFTERGYTVFNGKVAVDAAQKAETVWIPDPARPTTSRVDATPWEGTGAQPAPTSSATSTQPNAAPAAPLAALVVGLALAAARRRRWP